MPAHYKFRTIIWLNIICNILWKFLKLFRHEGVAKVFIFKHTAHLLYILCPNGSADVNFFSLKYCIFMGFRRARYHHFRIFRCASFGACGGVFFLVFYYEYCSTAVNRFLTNWIKLCNRYVKFSTDFNNSYVPLTLYF